MMSGKENREIYHALSLMLESYETPHICGTFGGWSIVVVCMSESTNEKKVNFRSVCLGVGAVCLRMMCLCALWMFFLSIHSNESVLWYIVTVRYKGEAVWLFTKNCWWNIQWTGPLQWFAYLSYFIVICSIFLMTCSHSALIALGTGNIYINSDIFPDFSTSIQLQRVGFKMSLQQQQQKAVAQSNGLQKTPPKSAKMANGSTVSSGNGNGNGTHAKKKSTDKERERNEREGIVLWYHPIQTIKYSTFETIELLQTYGKK